MRELHEYLSDKALRCLQQLEVMRDTRSELIDLLDTFARQLEQVERGLPPDERQPIIALIQDVKAETERVYNIHLDDMHYALDGVMSKYRGIEI